MQTRRDVVAGIGGAAVVASSGCIGFIRGEEAYEQTASAARVSDEAVEETGYTLDGIEEEVVEEEFEIAGQGRSVAATNYISTYEKTLGHPLVGEMETGVFAIVSTPAFEIAGRTLNPIADYDNEELVDMLASEYEDLDVDGEVDTATYTTLGQSVEVSKFDASATIAGQDIDVYVHVGSFQHEDDYLVPVGIYPQFLEGAEESNVRTLFESIQHPTDA